MLVRLSIDGKKAKDVPVKDWAEASTKVREFIDQNNLGSGCGSGLKAFTGGPVFEGPKQVGRISYNGRAWDMAGAPIAL